MKKYWPLSFWLFLFFISCKTTEEIWIEKDQSVRQHISIDLSAVVPFLQMGMQGEGLDLPGLPKFEDAMPQGNDDKGTPPDDFLKKMMAVSKLDTTINIKSLLNNAMQKQGVNETQFIQKALQDVKQDERKNAEALLKAILGANLRVQIDADEGVYNATLMQKFGAKEFAGAAKFLTALPGLMGGSKPEILGQGMDELNQAVPKYELTKKQFSLVKEPIAADKLGKNPGEENPLDMLGSLGGMMDYEYIIHVPGKIKSVNISHTKIDEKTIKVKGPSMFGDKNAEPFKLLVKYK